jgi:hypothetical protein
LLMHSKTTMLLRIHLCGLTATFAVVRNNPRLH